jgi:hypothetical protein
MEDVERLRASCRELYDVAFKVQRETREVAKRLGAEDAYLGRMESLDSQSRQLYDSATETLNSLVLQSFWFGENNDV